MKRWHRALAVLLLSAAGIASAQDYPSRPIKPHMGHYLGGAALAP